MGIAFYLDHHIPQSITNGLRLRGVDCLTAWEDNAAEMDDPDLLDRATALGRALVTSDKGFLIEAGRRQAQGLKFAGVIYTHALRISIRTCLDDLEAIAKAGGPEDFSDRVQFLPL